MWCSVAFGGSSNFLGCAEGTFEVPALVASTSFCSPPFPRLRAQRAVIVLRRLAILTPPRVAAAVWRTLWSGWCTARRFGGRKPCLFCGLEDGDSVEHVTVCRALAEFGAGYLRLPYRRVRDERRWGFLLLEPQSELTDERLTL